MCVQQFLDPILGSKYVRYPSVFQKKSFDKEEDISVSTLASLWEKVGISIDKWINNTKHKLEQSKSEIST